MKWIITHVLVKYLSERISRMTIFTGVKAEQILA